MKLIETQQAPQEEFIDYWTIQVEPQPRCYIERCMSFDGAVKRARKMNEVGHEVLRFGVQADYYSDGKMYKSEIYAEDE